MGMKKKSLFCLILGLFLLAPLSVFGASFDTVVVFGDSLSDNGNVYQQSSNTIPDPEKYYQGRYSNGPVWVEYLTGEEMLDCALVDNAYAGAETSGVDPVPGLVQQVGLYVGSATLPDNALFVIWIGANDFLGNPPADPATSVSNIAGALDALATFGVENILILNLPDLGSTPRMLGTAGAASATAITQAFNAALASAVDAFEAANPDIMVYELDIYTFLADISGNLAEYGFTNATEVSPNYAVADEFDNSAGYVFWDEIHPTTEAHEEIANQAYLLLPAEAENDDDNNGLGCFIRSVFSYN
jgi:phospholipase/lecithinase/hemolysin